MPDSNAQSTYAQLYRTFLAVDRAHERWLSGAGSNGARYAVLAAIAATDEPVTPLAVSEVTRRSPNAISPLLQGLESDGLIRRSKNPGDARSHYLTLSAAGKRTVKRLHTEEAAFVRRLLTGRPRAEMDRMAATLAAIETQAGTARRRR